MCQSADGWRESAGALTLAGFASAARCPASPTSSCRSWMSRQAREFPRKEWASTDVLFAPCAASRKTQSTKNQNGGTLELISPRVITRELTEKKKERP